MTSHGRTGQTTSLLQRIVFVTSMTSMVGWFTACGGAGDSSAPAKAPANMERPQKDDADRMPVPASIEEAQDQIARARADLASLASKLAAEAAPKSESSPSPSPNGGAATREERPQDSCASPCRALASMRRAVDALCRMAGNEDNRCLEAKRTLTDSTARASTCNCGAP